MIYVGNFTEAMKNYVEEKLSKLQKLTESDEFTTVKVGKKNSKDILRLEISCNGVRATANGEDFYHLVNECVDKIMSQIKRYKKTMSNKSRSSKFNKYLIETDDETEYAKEIVKEKGLYPDLLTDEEAIEEMELLDHNFFVYKSIDRERICVIYKRSEPGTYGVIVLN